MCTSPWNVYSLLTCLEEVAETRQFPNTMNDQPPAVFKNPPQGVEVNITGSNPNSYITACILIELKLCVSLYEQRKASMKQSTCYVIWTMSSKFPL